MPIRNPRINVILDKSLYGMIQKIARQEGLSLSLTARELIKEALEYYEDKRYLNRQRKATKGSTGKRV